MVIETSKRVKQKMKNPLPLAAETRSRICNLWIWNKEQLNPMSC
jgi:hypothetical protein